MVVRFGGISVGIECLGKALTPGVTSTMVPEAACETSLAVVNHEKYLEYSNERRGKWDIKYLFHYDVSRDAALESNLPHPLCACDSYSLPL